MALARVALEREQEGLVHARQPLRVRARVALGIGEAELGEDRAPAGAVRDLRGWRRLAPGGGCMRGAGPPASRGR
jgi:hypothetical protein